MKNKILLSYFLILFILGLSYKLKAQNNYIITNLVVDTSTYWNSTICDTTVTIGFYSYPGVSTNNHINIGIEGTNFEPSTFTIKVDWGFGFYFNYFGSVTNSGMPISLANSITHNYSPWISGTYPLKIIVTNNQNNSSDSISFLLNVSPCETMFIGYGNVDCDNDGIIESTIHDGIPLIVQGNNQTFIDTTNNGLISLSLLDPGHTYTVSVDPVWLNNFGYTATPAFNQFYVATTFSSFSVPITLTCSQATQNQQCIKGTVYCDVNSNGIYDQFTDIPKQGFPVNITTANGISLTTLSNINGKYSATFNPSFVTPINIEINPNWITMYGSSPSSSSSITLSQSYCNPQNQNINLGMNCINAPYNLCVSGYVWCDSNNDGIFNVNETPLMNVPVIMGNITMFTDSNGLFYYCGFGIGPTANITINSNWLNNNGFTTASSTYSITPTFGIYPQNNGIPVMCGSPTPNLCSDLWVGLLSLNGYYQGITTNQFKLYYGSYGPGTTGSYSIEIQFPNGTYPITSTLPTPYTITNNSIVFTFNAQQTTFYNEHFIQFGVDPGIPSGTLHYYTTGIYQNGTINECNLLNNVNVLLKIVGSSFDPNDKMVNKPTNIDPSVMEEFTYVIRFQNTGTAPAQNIFVLDTISQNLDLSTFNLIETSHPMQLLDLGNGVLKFHFPQIWLPDSNFNEPASHGHIVYKIKEKSTNTYGSEILNTAHIYFDWNPAIVTNTTYNLNGYTGIEVIKKESLKIYPNPTLDYLNLKFTETIKSISILDLSGRFIESKIIENNTAAIDVRHLSSGTYIVEIESKNGQKTRSKFVRR